MAEELPGRPRSILWYRWVGLTALILAILTFLVAVLAELSNPGAPANRPLFAAAVVCVLACVVTLPLLLVLAIRRRRLVRKQWRLVMMRAVWGGPFGTLGALWDLSADPAPGESAPD
jgi:hypothetical protein